MRAWREDKNTKIGLWLAGVLEFEPFIRLDSQSVILTHSFSIFLCLLSYLPSTDIAAHQWKRSLQAHTTYSPAQQHAVNAPSSAYNGLLAGQVALLPTLDCFAMARILPLHRTRPTLLVPGIKQPPLRFRVLAAANAAVALRGCKNSSRASWGQRQRATPRLSGHRGLLGPLGAQPLPAHKGQRRQGFGPMGGAAATQFEP
ncbi:hypothetical protein GGI35DRAFT_440496 [Trichoderma velutinum]